MITRDFHTEFVKAMKALLIFNNKDLTLLFKKFNAESENVGGFMDLVIKYANMSIVDCLDYINRLKKEK
jgi:hypothetical protein